MDLRLLKIEIPLNWELVESSPNRLVFKSQFIKDPYSSIELVNEFGKTFGLIKSKLNHDGSQILIGRGLPIEIYLLLIVDLFTESIFDIDELNN